MPPRSLPLPACLLACLPAYCPAACSNFFCPCCPSSRGQILFENPDALTCVTCGLDADASNLNGVDPRTAEWMNQTLMNRIPSFSAKRRKNIEAAQDRTWVLQRYASDAAEDDADDSFDGVIGRDRGYVLRVWVWVGRGPPPWLFIRYDMVVLFGLTTQLSCSPCRVAVCVFFFFLCRVQVQFLEVTGFGTARDGVCSAWRAAVSTQAAAQVGL